LQPEKERVILTEMLGCMVCLEDQQFCFREVELEVMTYQLTSMCTCQQDSLRFATETRLRKIYKKDEKNLIKVVIIKE